MIPLLVSPQEGRLDHMLDRILAVLEEQDLYALPGAVNRIRSDYFLSLNTTEDEDDDDDDDEDDDVETSRGTGSGDTSSMNHKRYKEQDDEEEMSNLDDNRNEVPIIVIRPVARRPRPQRRNYIVGTRRERNYGIGKGACEEPAEDFITGYRKITQCASKKKLRTSRSRSKSPMHHHRHNNSAGGASVQPKCQFPPINN